jgi:hypothetical protein
MAIFFLGIFQWILKKVIFIAEILEILEIFAILQKINYNSFP